jgi:nucleotide sugar dehydrogenase
VSNIEQAHVTEYGQKGKMCKVLVIGLGQIGYAVADYLTRHPQCEVYGYDISVTAQQRAESNIHIKIASDFKGFDVYIIAVSTHAPDDMFRPEIEGLLSVARKLSQEAKSGSLVAIESTIPKGTSRRVCEILKHNLHVVHAPHRWYVGDQAAHGVNQPRVLGGVYGCCTRAGMQFYANADQHDKNGNNQSFSGLGIPMTPLSEVEIAELTKVIENAHRYLQIAFAEELFLYCQANNINFKELRNALNSKWNVNILEPRQGIGGHCLPKDTRMFLNSSNVMKSKIISAAIEADELYKEYLRSTARDNRAVTIRESAA